MKIQFGQRLRVLVALVGGIGIQAGSLVASVIAQDTDGNDRSGDYTIIPNPDNELEFDVQHSGTNESTGVVRVQVDGDRDGDEESLIIGTLAVVADEPNVTAIELSASVVTGGGETGGGTTGGETGGGTGGVEEAPAGEAPAGEAGGEPAVDLSGGRQQDTA